MAKSKKKDSGPSKTVHQRIRDAAVNGTGVHLKEDEVKAFFPLIKEQAAQDDQESVRGLPNAKEDG